MQPSMGPSLPPTAHAGQYSESAGTSKLYGALMDQELAHKAEVLRRLPPNRRRVNCVPLLLSLLLPWALFMLCFGMAAFYIRYTAPMATLLFQVAVLALCLKNLAAAWQGRLVGFQEGFFPLQLAFALTLASLFGWGLGDLTFWSFMGPTFSADHMATYSNVDPSSQRMPSGEVQPTRGGRFQDAGKIYFKSEVIVDTSRSTSFRMGDLYCVAPIVNPNCQKNCGMDFWAVGVNCCAEDKPDFRCGDVASKTAKSGIRLLSDTQRPFFRMAVLQAEGHQKIKSPHPLFFQWVEDPVDQTAMVRRKGTRQFLIAMVAGFLANTAFLGASLKLTPLFWRW